MSLADCPMNKDANCWIPISDPGSKEACHLIASHNLSKNCKGVSLGPCQKAYKADQFIVFGIACSIPFVI